MRVGTRRLLYGVITLAFALGLLAASGEAQGPTTPALPPRSISLSGGKPEVCWIITFPSWVWGRRRER